MFGVDKNESDLIVLEEFLRFRNGHLVGKEFFNKGSFSEKIYGGNLVADKNSAAGKCGQHVAGYKAGENNVFLISVIFNPKKTIIKFFRNIGVVGIVVKFRGNLAVDGIVRDKRKKNKRNKKNKEKFFEEEADCIKSENA